MSLLQLDGTQKRRTSPNAGRCARKPQSAEEQHRAGKIPVRRRESKYFSRAASLTVVDDSWTEGRRFAPLSVLTAVLAAAAIALALFVWHEQRSAASNRAALESQIAALRQSVTRLSRHDTTLASRLG